MKDASGSGGSSVFADISGEPTRTLGPPVSIGDDLSPGDEVGRYIILRHLGRGGMGDVYAANDPDLNRDVALKLVHAGRSEREQARLVREARAMARLSHPNVVAVHDVGVVEGRAFIAMELVEGNTLGGWLEQTSRSWREIVALFISAGEGLAAAHRSGLIHRDFKPGNVLVDLEGRAKVTDFGISQALVARTSVEHTLSEGLPSGPHPSGEVSLTHVTGITGTPAYMSPEQHRGALTSECSDQFSFCVAVYAAVYGVRPFDGPDSDQLVAQIVAGTLQAPNRPSGAPRSLVRILAKGLRAAPSERYEDMDALLGALRRLLGRRRRRLSGAAGVVLLSGAGTLGWAMQGTPDPVLPSCAGGEALVDPAWNPDTKAAIHAAFRATDLPFAEPTWSRVEATLDAFVDDFVTDHRAACEATRVHGTQADEVLALRMACLQGRAEDLDAFVSVLREADRSVVEQAPKAARTFSDLRACDERRVVEERVAPPPPERAEEVEEAMHAWRHANMLTVSGRWKDARRALETLFPVVDQIAYLPLTARVHSVAARLYWELGEGVEGEASAERAMLAASSIGDHRAAAEAMIVLAYLVGSTQTDRMAEALRWTRQADALLDTLSEPARLRVETRRTRGAILRQERQDKEALAEYDDAILALENAEGVDASELAVIYSGRGDTLTALGRYDEAAEAHSRVAELVRTSLGDEHPRMIMPVHNLAVAYANLGDHQRAAPLFRRACDLTAKHMGEGSYKEARCLVNLSISMNNLGELGQAQAVLERALEIFEASVGSQHITVGVCLNNLGEILGNRGQYEAAEARFAQANDILRTQLGADNLDYVSHLVSWGKVQCDRGPCERALDEFSRALEVQENAWGPDHPEIAVTLTGLSRAHLARGRVDKAREAAERALLIAERTPVGVHRRALAQMALAQALWTSSADRSTAVMAAERARDLLSEDGAPHILEVERVERWLATHRLDG